MTQHRKDKAQARELHKLAAGAFSYIACLNLIRRHGYERAKQFIIRECGIIPR